MKKGKFAKRGHRGAANKTLALILSMVLIIGCVAGGTLAWLTANTDAVVNKFDNSTIGVELNETTTTYKMVPGWTIEKNPIAKVLETGEDCYLFVEVQESCGVSVNGATKTFDDFIKYAIATGWETLESDNDSGVYYKVIDTAEEKSAEHHILGSGTYTFEDMTFTWGEDEVLTKPEVTKDMMDAVTDANQPKLTFKAYAVQLWKNNKPADGATEAEIAAAQFTAAEAWALK